MAVKSRRFFPRHPFICICDPTKVNDFPTHPSEFPGDKQIHASNTFIVVLMDTAEDFRAKVSLGPADEAGPATPPVFDRVLDTPTRSVRVATSDDRALLVQSVPERHTRIRIWGNRPEAPDEVIIGLG